MVSDIVSRLRLFSNSLLTSSAPGQIAAGFTLGMLIGVMPKSNLIALSLCVVLFSLRCNKGLGLAVAVMFSLVSPLTDPIAHRLGAAMLQTESMQGAYAAAFNMPLGPWVGFNNTVVTGSFLLGLYLAYPVYFALRMLLTVVQSTLQPEASDELAADADVQTRAAA